MQFKRRPKQEIALDITPLIDVVFLLLIFFMVSTTFTDKTELTVDLPEAHGEIQTKQKEVINVLITATGDFFINDQKLLNNDFATLKTAVEQLKSQDANPVYIITADGNTPHKAVVMAMDVAGQLGISHLSVTTKNSSE